MQQQVQGSNVVIIFFRRLLVGAPRAQTGQPGVENPGAVYKCRPDAPGSCDIIPFDTTGESESGRAAKPAVEINFARLH